MKFNREINSFCSKKNETGFYGFLGKKKTCSKSPENVSKTMKQSILAVKMTVFARKKKGLLINTYFYRLLDKKHALNRRKMSLNSRELPGGSQKQWRSDGGKGEGV